MITYGEIVEYAFARKTNYSLVNWSAEDLLNHLVTSANENRIVVTTDEFGFIKGFGTFKLTDENEVHIVTLIADNKEAVKALLKGLKNIVPAFSKIQGFRRKKNKFISYPLTKMERFYGT